jgi:chemotaxis protein MotB
MMMIKRIVTFPAIIAALIILTSCADMQTIIKQQEEKLADNSVLINSLTSQLQSCQNELAISQAQCSEQLSIIATEDKQLLLREKQLREQLANDITLKNLEIEKLQGRLSLKVMDKILFHSGSIVILPEGQALLIRIAESLVYASENFRIEGHTDDVPIGAILVQRIPTNWELSVLRATSVVRFLEENNIDPKRMSATGHSEFKPIAENTTDENKQLNRRVEIILVPQ